MWTTSVRMVTAVVFAMLTVSTSSLLIDADFTDDGIEELRREVNAMRSVVGLLLTKSDSSTSYVRWGRKSCEGRATVVYKGYAAGPTHRDESGSGGNYVCLHENPQWKRQRSDSGWSANIYGVQYELWENNNNVFSLSNNGGRDLAPHPAPCVMCNVPKRSTVVMIPARTDCPAGWNKEYGGYMVSSHKGYAKSSYVCWDDAPETAQGGHNVDQSVIYTTRVRCGTLPCTTYGGDRELTCVVCSK